MSEDKINNSVVQCLFAALRGKGFYITSVKNGIVYITEANGRAYYFTVPVGGEEEHTLFSEYFDSKAINDFDFYAFANKLKGSGEILLLAFMLEHFKSSGYKFNRYDGSGIIRMVSPDNHLWDFTVPRARCLSNAMLVQPRPDERDESTALLHMLRENGYSINKTEVKNQMVAVKDISAYSFNLPIQLQQSNGSPIRTFNFIDNVKTTLDAIGAEIKLTVGNSALLELILNHFHNRNYNYTIDNVDLNGHGIRIICCDAIGNTWLYCIPTLMYNTEDHYEELTDFQLESFTPVVDAWVVAMSVVTEDGRVPGDLKLPFMSVAQPGRTNDKYIHALPHEIGTIVHIDDAEQPTVRWERSGTATIVNVKEMRALDYDAGNSSHFKAGGSDNDVVKEVLEIEHISAIVGGHATSHLRNRHE